MGFRNFGGETERGRCVAFRHLPVFKDLLWFAPMDVYIRAYICVVYHLGMGEWTE
jgi:hypothetical protein